MTNELGLVITLIIMRPAQFLLTGIFSRAALKS